MRRLQVTFFSLLVSIMALSQNVTQQLDVAVKKMMADTTMKHAIMGFYVVNSKTNEVVYDLNNQVGLAPASCQKIITSIAAFDLLGKDYRWKTELGYDGIIRHDSLHGNFHVTGYGDPTLGSWRYASTKPEAFCKEVLNSLERQHIKVIVKDCYLNSSAFSFQPVPGGWIWDDLGNYYGAGHFGLNWNENQYSLLLKAGNNEGDDVEIIGTEPSDVFYSITNLLKTGKRGSGDNAYIYSAPYTVTGFVEGTIPAGEKEFKIAGSMPMPMLQLQSALDKKVFKHDIQVIGKARTSEGDIANKRKFSHADSTFYTHYSPPFDSVNHHFLRRSVNLYGEAFLKTIAYEKTGFGSTDSGVAIIRRYWQERGIEKSALHIKDGSGLSPQNRITANSLVTALQYAKQQPWFSSFYEALPTYNQMKLKSGTIGGAKSFAGYHKAKDGTEYTIAIIVNNFDGAASNAVNKMFKVLDELK